MLVFAQIAMPCDRLFAFDRSNWKLHETLSDRSGTRKMLLSALVTNYTNNIETAATISPIVPNVFPGGRLNKWNAHPRIVSRV